MTKIALGRDWSQRLLTLPESGMGYQRVRVRLKDGRIFEDAIALNAEVLDLPPGTTPFNPADIAEIQPVKPDK